MEIGKTKVTDGVSGRQVPEVKIRKPSVTTWQDDMLELCGYGQDGVSEEDAVKRAITLFFGNFTVKYQHDVKDELIEAKPEELAEVIARLSDATEYVYVAKPREPGKGGKAPSVKTVKNQIGKLDANKASMDELKAIVEAAQAKIREAEAAAAK